MIYQINIIQLKYISIRLLGRIMTHKMRKVILVIEDASSYCRELIRGISRYAQVHGPWAIYRNIHDSSYRHGRELRKEFYDHLYEIDADGLITRSPERTKEITKKGVPTVIAITETHASGNIPKLDIAHDLIGKMAAEYFIERGYTNFAFYGNIRYHWTRLRYEGFKAAAGKHNFYYYDHPTNREILTKGVDFKINHLASWLVTLPKPVGLMACSDAWAVNVIEACKLVSIHIPEQLAILGVDNDEPICLTCFPQLSSISLNAETSGFKAAQLLDDLMNGRKPENKKIFVEPVQVVTRTSTDVMAITDNDVAESLQFIRASRREPIQVIDVASKVGVSRRTLQNKFRQKLNRSILDEIKNSRIAYAKELLLNTDMNISEISNYMNFPGINSFSRYFKNETELSPIEYRRKYGRR
ncbi:MAG: hypothetical protein A2Y10_17555 [Planctomycetes bacterium GWF2_41_51]|nr:MAG: hypothetical protein A2Y10_17555 [Planctomycetes bacterium GWF2_41_51]HBG28033.1 hypothetical protein [Phycisphaerales bacterium]